MDIRIEGYEMYKEDVGEARYQVFTARVNILELIGAARG